MARLGKTGQTGARRRLTSGVVSRLQGYHSGLKSLYYYFLLPNLVQACGRTTAVREPVGRQLIWGA
jgi:hypothetical protein